MAYTWEGMKKLNFKEVVDMHNKGELVGCFYLYPDGTEAQIEEGYQLRDIVKSYLEGCEFGAEK